MGGIRRPDDYRERRKHLAGLSDAELRERFWRLAEEVVRPLVDLAAGHTSPSIERSVLLRMGLSSLEARAVVEKCVEKGWLGKGAGHLVWRLARDRGLDLREAGRRLAAGEHWDLVEEWFGAGGRGQGREAGRQDTARGGRRQG